MIDVKKLDEYIEKHRDEALDFLKDLVNMEGKHGETEKLRKTAQFMAENFSQAGLKTEVIEVGEINGPIVTAVLNEDVDEKEIVFTGHYDTIFEAGSRGENPFRQDENKIYGPGVSDMKGGITVAFFAVKALKEMGFRGCPVRLFFMGDEEVNHVGGNAIELLKEATKDILVAFNMESGYESGDICVGRKGCYDYRISVEGVAAHPGHGYDVGKNAIQEMAYKVIDLQNCTPKEKDRKYSVNVGTIKGGTVTNSVPAHCEATIDVRVSDMKSLAECEAKMEAVAAKTYIEGTTTTLVCEDAMIPFETTENVKKAYEIVKAIGDEAGIHVGNPIVVGGSSDAAYTASIGSKVLCQCGILGGLIHNEKEYSITESIYERIKLFVHVLSEFERFK